MRVSRRGFHQMMGALAMGGIPLAGEATQAPVGATKRPHYFFEDATFEMIFLTALGRAYHSGANLHCEPKGMGIRDLRIFNWLDETLRNA